jgi:plasmid maintenance system antidote protein VapI
MAIRLEKAGLGAAESWLRNQLSYDLWNTRRRAKSIKVTPFPAPQASEQRAFSDHARVRRGVAA